MFKGYTEAGLHKQTLLLFSQMTRRDVRPNLFTFPFVIISCMVIPAPRSGAVVHCFAGKTGLGSNVFVGNSLINMYASKGDVGSAYKVFEDMPAKNVVIWTTIVRAYVSVGNMGMARYLFDQLEERDVILWDTMVSAYIQHGDMGAAQDLFAKMPVRDIRAWNTILLGYANSHNIAACKEFFDRMPERNVFSWNGLIGGYNDQLSDVLSVFRRMLISSDVKPNDATLVTVLSSCSKLGALNWGRWVHLYAENNGFKGNNYVGNGLIDMYTKCGCIQSAIDVFDAMQNRDIITWNTMINGLAMHGMGLAALELFDQMVEVEKPDGITFVGLLNACAHMGLVERGLACFRSMKQCYFILPCIEHYGCMVDLLGRAGLLDEAISFVKVMPMEPDDVIWSALLGGCRVQHHICLAEAAMARLVRLVPEDAANYVVLSNIYGDAGRWEDFAMLQKVLRRMNSGKSPGCSLIEVNMEVTEFCSSDARHGRVKEIYEILESLTNLTKCTDDTEFDV
ncbi:hypothetical protein HPP92_011055 [Vanilla planifolia]|uniref:Chlororespiratory reduction 4 n=1 Tax=Vanilla planifolia TaxID=51239 RepID=A0A835R4W7_VANPL|nr:hypothetical protein HPP92_011055 [Vanilla planifolia]